MWLFETEGGKTEKANFSNFELLKREVDHLKEIVIEQAHLLNDNNLTRKLPAPVFDQKEVYAQLLEPGEKEEQPDNDGDPQEE